MTEQGEYRRLSPLTPVVRGPIFILAVLGTSWRELIHGELGWVTLGLLGVLVAGLSYGAASWVRTKFWIDEMELRVDTGVIARQSRRIRIDRLQGVDIVQPFVARLFGLAELKMDVAGGGQEGSLAFLTLRDARELRETLLVRRDLARRDLARRDASRRGGPAPASESGEPTAPERVLFRLDAAMLVASVALSSEAVLLLTALVTFGAFALLTGATGALTGFVPAVGGLGLVLFRRLNGYYRFTLTDAAIGLQVRRGLLVLTHQTVALTRVQGLVVSEPWLWRLLGWARVDVSVAGSARGDDADKLQSSTIVPVAPREQAMHLARHALLGCDPDAVRMSPPPPRSGWVRPIGRLFEAAGLDDRLVVSRGGWLRRRTHVVPLSRVQSVRLDQGPRRRFLGLADVHVDSPPGPVHVQMALRSEAEARSLLEDVSELARRARRHPRSTPPS